MRSSDWSSDVCSSDLSRPKRWAPLWAPPPPPSRSARQLLVRRRVRARRIVAEAADLVLFIGFEIAFEPFDMAVALEREDVRREAIEEEAVVADDHRAARKILQRLFECRQRFGVEIVGRFVEQQHVAALFQHLRHMDDRKSTRLNSSH